MTSAVSRAAADSSTDAAFADLVEELTARLQRGEPFEVEACLREHPEHQPGGQQRGCRPMPAHRREPTRAHRFDHAASPSIRSRSSSGMAISCSSTVSGSWSVSSSMML